MFSVHVNYKKNRVYLDILRPTPEDYERGLNEYEQVSLKMRPNFTCLTDFRRFGPPGPEHRGPFGRIQEMAWATGLAKSARVVEPADLNDFGRRVLGVNPPRYIVEYTTTLEEAESILDAFRREITRPSGRGRRISHFKIIGRDGWQDAERYPDYVSALCRLKALRAAGRTDAVIAPAASRTGENPK